MQAGFKFLYTQINQRIKPNAERNKVQSTDATDGGTYDLTKKKHLVLCKRKARTTNYISSKLSNFLTDSLSDSLPLCISPFNGVGIIVRLHILENGASGRQVRARE